MRPVFFSELQQPFASLVSISFIASCTKEDAKTDKETTEQPQEVDNYYVKYEVNTEKRIYICDKYITYKDVDNEKESRMERYLWTF